ncbi:MAG: hypothetical protein HF962_06885 [Sulfurovum sp.]|nr:hypothetical protein [Sulfurovum sp.]
MRIISILLMLLCLGGCSSKHKSLKVYTLNANSVVSMQHGKYRTKILRVTYSRSIKEKVNNKMRFSYSASEQGVYQDSQWSNNIGRLLQGVLIDNLERSAMFRAVLPYTSSLKEDYRLESNILDFSHWARGDSSYAIVSIQFTLININTGDLVKSKRFRYKEPTDTRDAKGYADATNRIMSRLCRDLLKWL